MSKIDVIKENLQFQQLLRENSSTAILQEEYLIPDTHPDVQGILEVEAKPKITSKEIVGEKVMLEGKVEYTVLYIPRDENEIVNCVSYSEKFTSSLSLGENEHNIVCEVECKVEHIDARIMNERKIEIQGVIDLDWELYKTIEFDFVKEIQATEGIEVLKNVESINRLVASKETELIGKSMIRVSMDKPQIDKILKCSMRLHKKEVKVGEDKVFLGCYCALKILYVSSETNEIITLDDDIYLSKEEEIAGIFADMIPSVSYEIKSYDLAIENDDLGESRIVNIEFLLESKIKIFSDENIDVIKDAYSPKLQIEIKRENYEIGALLGSQVNESTIKDNIYLKEGDLKPEKIIESSENIIITDKSITDDKITVEGIIKVNIVYKALEEGEGFAEVSTDIPFTSVLDMLGAKNGMKAIVKCSLENIEANLEANTIAIKANISMWAKVFYEVKKEFISDVIEGDGDIPKKKASITIYIIGKGDTLWKLAKKYNCTVDEIIQINSIDNPDNIVEGEKLIIPGRAVFN